MVNLSHTSEKTKEFITSALLNIFSPFLNKSAVSEYFLTGFVLLFIHGFRRCKVLFQFNHELFITSPTGVHFFSAENMVN